ncbi:MAG: radical SAM family heme chaperone HemW [Alphaproteobacteria bacterium]|nr:radical SAM family heme chaperone HemW [Alphaproteobacteria bacterium]
MTVPHNIYIHVPFCTSKCNYCTFYSVVCQPDWNAYAARIANEIKYWGRQLGTVQVPSIFFGGGTPSLMPVSTFAEIMDTLRTVLDIPSKTEITLEANPGTLSATRLAGFKTAGVNRLSVGVQSLDDNILQFLGRRHNARAARGLVKSAQDMGLRVSGDFIYGLPGQTVANVEKMCRDILNMELRHASLYELSIEPGTVFAQQKLRVPSNEIITEMYQIIGDILPRYEVSNYAALYEECRHNQNIWDGQPYIGIGQGACGRIFANGVWYEQGEKCEPMDSKTRAVEKVMTGLRTTRGVLLTPDVRDVIDMEFIGNNQKYLNITDGRLAATHSGILILDNLLVKLLV